MVFRKIFNLKLRAEEILLQNEGDLSIHERSSLNDDNNKGKGNVLMVSATKNDVDAFMRSRGRA